MFGIDGKPVVEKHEEIFQEIGQEATAIEIMQWYTGNQRKVLIPWPQPCDTVAGGEISVYCDGSFKKPRGEIAKMGD